MYKIFQTTETAANECGEMESRDHSKNGASPKSQTSRGNFSKIALTLTAILFAFASFTKEKGDYRKIFCSL